MDQQAPNSDQPTAKDSQSPRPVIPDHELIRCIGEGSYGQIWLVKSILGTYRAAKVVFRQNFRSAVPFEREFRGIHTYEPISRSHEGLVDILQVGRNNACEYFYYVMELADDQFTRQTIDPEMYTAKTLEGELQLRGRMPAEECIEIGLALSASLLHLHRHGMVHRDIKPANIIFVDGQVKLADIGLVVDVREAKTIVGTDGFIAPEGPGTPQADIYSLGKVLYEMATGKDRLDYPEPSTRLGEFSDRRELCQLAKVIYRACAAKPQGRYATVEALHADLLRLTQSQIKGKASRIRWPIKILLGLGAFAFLLLALFLLLVWRWWPDPDKLDLAENIQVTTNALEIPLPVGGLTPAEILSGHAFVVIKFKLAPSVVKSQRVLRQDFPEPLNRLGLPVNFLAFAQDAQEFKIALQGTNVPAVQISSRCEPEVGFSRTARSNTSVTVFSPQPPRKILTTAVFKIPTKGFDPDSSFALYQRENTLIPIMVSLRRRPLNP
jgi:serine/threonine protein kinase